MTDFIRDSELTPAERAILDQNIAGATDVLNNLVASVIEHMEEEGCDTPACLGDEANFCVFGHMGEREVRIILAIAAQWLAKLNLTFGPLVQQVNRVVEEQPDKIKELVKRASELGIDWEHPEDDPK